MATSNIFRIWQTSRIFDFLIFFQKIQHKVLHLKIQLILSILRVWHLKIGPKTKKWSEIVENGTKPRIKREFEMSYDRNCFTNI